MLAGRLALKFQADYVREEAQSLGCSSLLAQQRALTLWESREPLPRGVNGKRLAQAPRGQHLHQEMQRCEPGLASDLQSLSSEGEGAVACRWLFVSSL